MESEQSRANSFRFSGHESFACRYAWLPKAYRAIAADPSIFFNEDQAMVELGIGKNMVRSLRFWVDATGLTRVTVERQHELTELAHKVFGSGGFDPFLEDRTTLWLLHWNLASVAAPSLFAWHQLLSVWPYPDFTRSEALAAFTKQSAQLGFSHSPVTLSQHLDVFLHTYFTGANGRVAIEDSLDGPLVELKLLLPSGERRSDAGKWEQVFAFRFEPKEDLSNALFEYSVLDFWKKNSRGELTLSVRDIASAAGSPGQVFKLPEDDIRIRLEHISRSTKSSLAYTPSAIQGLVTRKHEFGMTMDDLYTHRIKHAA